jgi:Phosphotransferase enzyme family
VIPKEVDDLTPEWLAEALGRAVTAVEVVDAHSGTTGRVKLRLQPGGDTVFCKIAPFDPRQRAFLDATGIGVMEARFYASVLDGLPVRAPRPLHASVDDAGGFVMVLEDIEASGCTFPRPSDPDVDERAASTVAELAHLHAVHWESAELVDGALAWVPERAGFGAGGSRTAAAAAGAGRFVRMALERFAADMPPVFTAIGQLYADRAADVLDLWDQGERTLIHGDPHSGNLFTDRGRTGFFDWAMISRSPGMRDVAYYLCNSIPTDVRHAIEADLLGSYRQVLAGHGVRLDPALVARQHRLFAVYSWVSATSTAAMGSRWQPSDRAIAGMERATRAVDDLDCVGLLRELL